MKFKFLIVLTIVLSAFLVLPVNAEGEGMTAIIINDNAHDFTVNNIDTVYLWAGKWRTYFSTYVTAAPKGSIINNKQITKDTHGYTTSASVATTLNAGIYNLNQVVTSFNNPATINGMIAIPYALNNPQHSESLSYTYIQGNGYGGLDNSAIITGTIYFNYDDNYSSGLDSARIIADIISYTDNTVTYKVQCISDYPNTIAYTEIGEYTEFSLEDVDLYENNTEKTITVGINGNSVYSWALNLNNGNIKQLQLYLNGRSEIEDIPSIPSDQIPFEIEFIDYDKGIQLIGANLTVYYYDESSNTLTQTYRNANCNGLERIAVTNNSVLFLEYNLNGYNAVNIDSYEFLNNRQGKLIDSNLKSARLYFSKIDPSVLLFQGFIIKDSFGNALSGVSVTMDNNQTVISNQYGGVRFDNINQGTHTFVFSKTGYYSQSLSKSITVSNTQNILLVSSQPTTAPTVKPTPLQTDSQGNIIIEKPSNLSDSIKYGLAKIFGITSIDSINLIFALILILFPAVIGGTITNQALGFISGGMIGFVFALAVGLIPIWVFFSMVMFAVIYLILTHSNDGF